MLWVKGKPACVGDRVSMKDRRTITEVWTFVNPEGEKYTFARVGSGKDSYIKTLSYDGKVDVALSPKPAPSVGRCGEILLKIQEIKTKQEEQRKLLEQLRTQYEMLIAIAEFKKSSVV